jgi:Diguanylate cyclase, GGDEF domain
VLKTFADILKTHTRQSDICARLGGEEFLLMMTHADKVGTRIAVERIRKQFANTSVTLGDSRITATASFGIAGFHGNKSPDWNAQLASGVRCTSPRCAIPEPALPPIYPSVPVAAFPGLSISSTLRRSSEGRKGFSRMVAPILISSRNLGKSSAKPVINKNFVSG